MNFVLKIHVLAVFLMAFQASFGQQEKSQKKPAEFLGIVQFANGDVKWRKRPTRNIQDEIGFKTFLHLNSQIELKSAAKLKLITAQRCVGVVYGPGILKTPQDRQNVLWQYNGKALRWICPSGSTQNLRSQKQNFVLIGGEILLSGNHLYTLKDTVKLNSTTLKNNTYHQRQGNTWKFANFDKKKLYDLSETFSAPKEATKVSRPENREISRWIMGFNEAGASMTHTEKNLQSKDIELEGEELHFQYKMGTGSLIGYLQFVETETPGNRGFCDGPFCDFSTKEPNINNSVESFFASLGYRPQHDRNWSWYWTLGVGEMKFRIERHRLAGDNGTPNDPFDDQYYHISRNELFFGVAGHLGIDYFYKFSGFFDWFAIYGAADIYTFQTISHKETQDLCDANSVCDNSDPEIKDTNTEFGITGLGFRIGLVIRI